MLDLATSGAEPAVDLTWCFYAREEVGGDDSGCSSSGGGGLIFWPVTPPFWASPPMRWSRPGARGRCVSGSRSRVSGPTRRVRSPAATPSTGWAPLLSRVADWAGRKVVLDGCTYAEQLQAVAWRAAWPATWCPTLPASSSTTAMRPDRGGPRRRRSCRLLDDLLEPGDTWELVDAADGAPPSLGAPAAGRPGRAQRRRSRAKVAGPTRRRSGSTGSRRPTSVPATRCWPITPRSG